MRTGLNPSLLGLLLALGLGVTSCPKSASHSGAGADDSEPGTPGAACDTNFDCSNAEVCSCDDQPGCMDGECRPTSIFINDAREACTGLCDWRVACGQASSQSDCYQACGAEYEAGGTGCREAQLELGFCLEDRAGDCNALETACACGQSALTTECAPNGPNNCRWAGDGFCDENSARPACAPGTDTDDCLGWASCPTVFNDVCDEPSPCAPGTDGFDCACQ